MKIHQFYIYQTYPLTSWPVQAQSKSSDMFMQLLSLDFQFMDACNLNIPFHLLYNKCFRADTIWNIRK